MKRTCLVLMLVLLPACSLIPAEMREPLDKAIKDHGAGDYEAQLILKKDGKQLVGVTGKMTCTENAVKMTGCHKNGLSVEGPK